MRRNDSYPPQARKEVVQAEDVERDAAATRRAVMSARSIERPSMRNCQPSSRGIVASAVPLMSAARPRTHAKAAGGAMVANRPFGRASQVVLTASHIEVESVSRARRATSRAARRVAWIDAGDAGS